MSRSRSPAAAQRPALQPLLSTRAWPACTSAPNQRLIDLIDEPWGAALNSTGCAIEPQP